MTVKTVIKDVLPKKSPFLPASLSWLGLAVICCSLGGGWGERGRKKRRGQREGRGDGGGRWRFEFLRNLGRWCETHIDINASRQMRLYRGPQ